MPLSVTASERPQNLVIFINPNSGKQQAEKVFAKKVQPLLQICGISTTVIGEYLHMQFSSPVDKTAYK
jgi:hypothetical protein